MTPNSRRSASRPPVDSSQSLEQIALRDPAIVAEALIAQLSDAAQHDLLTRWIVERIAEVAAELETRRTAKAELTKLVMDLWRHRAGWGTGWPTDAMQVVANLIGSPTAPRYARTGTDLESALASLLTEMRLTIAALDSEPKPPGLGVDSRLLELLGEGERWNIRFWEDPVQRVNGTAKQQIKQLQRERNRLLPS